MAVVILSGPEQGGKIDIHLRDFLPFVNGAFAIISLIRRERMVWGIVGIILTALYVGLHLIAIP